MNIYCSYESTSQNLKQERTKQKPMSDNYPLVGMSVTFPLSPDAQCQHETSLVIVHNKQALKLSRPIK